MTEQKKEGTKKTETPKDQFQAEFEALPLEKKFASLLRMEAVTLSETFAFVVDSPMKVVEKVGDVIMEFGTKLENEMKKATRPSDPRTDQSTGKKTAPKAKSRPTKSTSNPRAAK